MLQAYNDSGKPIKPYPGGKGLCPGCNTPIIAKCGKVNSWHWAHESLEDCDGWKYEPMTEWHLKWQSYFHPDDTEVIVSKQGRFHIADIMGINGLVIEIQNSSITAEEVQIREEFYGKTLWVLNGHSFAENLRFPAFSDSMRYDSVKMYFKVERRSLSNNNAVIITVPIGDMGTIENCLLKNPKVFRRSEENDKEFYADAINLDINPTEFNFYGLPKEVRNVYAAFVLHEQISLVYPEEKDSWDLDMEWMRMKRSFTAAKMPIFIDIGNNYLI